METALANLSAVIICGQTGNELWPLARASFPRETVTLPGESESLLESSIKRARSLTSAPILFVVPQQIATQIEKCINASGLLKPKDYEMMVLPCETGTAFSIALAAATLKLRNPNSYMLLMPSHLKMQQDDKWEQAVSRAYRAAAEDMIAVLAVESRKSNTPHCFIRPAQDVKGIVGAKHCSVFTSHPNRSQIARFVQLGLLWSTGIMVVRATEALAQLSYVAKHTSAPDSQGMDRVAETATFLASVERSMWNSNDALGLINSLPHRSYEEAVLEVSPNVAVIPTTLEFSQITSLQSIDDIMQPDENDNRVIGRGLAIDCDNTTIYDDDRLTVTLGCVDTIVVNTRDSVFVASKDRLDQLSSVVPALVEAGAKEAVESSISSHGWGTSTIVFKGKGCRSKLVEIKPGKSMGEYSRSKVSEIWTVLEGSVVCTANGESKSYKVGQQLGFKPHDKHELKNTSSHPVHLSCIEYSSSANFADDGIL